MTHPPAKATSPFLRHHLLAVVPLLALLSAPYVANRLEPRILGMPFLLGWIVVWVLITSGVMALILQLDGSPLGGSPLGGDQRDSDTRTNENDGEY
ncbi:MAG: DUF3311 domain-containing protein [Gemmatimonadaceae bacterium]